MGDLHRHERSSRLGLPVLSGEREDEVGDARLDGVEEQALDSIRRLVTAAAHRAEQVHREARVSLDELAEHAHRHLQKHGGLEDLRDLPVGRAVRDDSLADQLAGVAIGHEIVAPVLHLTRDPHAPPHDQLDVLRDARPVEQHAPAGMVGELAPARELLEGARRDVLEERRPAQDLAPAALRRIELGLFGLPSSEASSRIVRSLCYFEQITELCQSPL